MSDFTLTTPTGNTVYLWSKQNTEKNQYEVSAKVCKKEECSEEIILFEYKGAEKDKRAAESARNLAQVITNRDLYLGDISLKDKRALVIDKTFDNHRLPNMVFNYRTLIDFSGEKLNKSERDEKIGSFLNGLWTSGIISPADIARVHTDILEYKFLGVPRAKYRYRDPKLQGYLDLARYHFQAKNYDKAEEYCYKIIGNHLTVTTARPVYYDEAVFLLTDTKRLQAIKTWSIEFLNQAMQTLLEHEKKLKKLEYGYKVRYNYELLKTCVLSEQLFPGTEWKYAAYCREADLKNYSMNTTFIYNHRAPVFSDNFIASRTFLQMAEHHLANENLADAIQEYQKALDLIGFIRNSYSINAASVENNWNSYSPYMGTVSQFVARHFGKKAALHTFTLYSEIARTLRGDFRVDWEKIQSKQFNPKYFLMFEAQTYRGFAQIYMKAAESNPSQVGVYLSAARSHLDIALSRVKEIKKKNVIDFFSHRMFDERTTYYRVLVDYADLLVRTYALKKDDPKLLDQADNITKEVIKNNADEPTDEIYLRARLVQANINLENKRYPEAAKQYQVILKAISEMEKKLAAGQKLPPYYQNLKARAQSSAAIISEIIGRNSR